MDDIGLDAKNGEDMAKERRRAGTNCCSVMEVSGLSVAPLAAEEDTGLATIESLEACLRTCLDPEVAARSMLGVAITAGINWLFTEDYRMFA